MKKILVIFSVLMIAVISIYGDIFKTSDRIYSLKLNYENGMIKIINHTLRFGDSSSNTTFDYVTQGGQEILFPFERFSAEFKIGERNNIIFLYQPLTIETTVPLKDQITIDDTVFTTDGNDTLNIKYGFPFWRVSYVYDFLSNEKFNLGAGLSLQLRNASIVFKKENGEIAVVNQNLGPVPIIKIKARMNINDDLYIETDSDGFYATSKWFNGADFNFSGSIWDISVKGGIYINKWTETFINIRYLGGSASGVSQYGNTAWSQGNTASTENYLGSFILSLGFTIK
ncbi:MAG TPA: hypothetical protein PLS66_02490 [Tepiditoga sp.]|nr:hypothetical protein [Tepiditoga sp.]